MLPLSTRLFSNWSIPLMLKITLNLSQKCCVYSELADQEGPRTVITSDVDLVPPVHRPTPLLTKRNKSSSGE